MRYKISFTRLTHHAGAKKYAIDFVEREDGAILLLFQWGKDWGRGRLESRFFKPSETGRAIYTHDMKINEKKKRGYADLALEPRLKTNIASEQDLAEFYQGSSNRWWLKILKDHRRLIVGEVVDMAKHYASHPLFGRF